MVVVSFNCGGNLGKMRKQTICCNFFLQWYFITLICICHVLQSNLW